MTIIESFLKQYEREYDFYKQLAALGNDVLETEIFNRGIKAIVSNRAKRIDRLKEKLLKRNEKKNYKSKAAIEKDIVDLAGIRVALYFPSDRKILEQVILELFVIIEKKEFPEEPQKPKLNKRFSGYWATHFRVKLKKHDDIEERFTSTVFEIQVASVLMHAWSEVEHDLVYKPLSGELSEDELAILDEINGLVIAGEIALERLQKAITNRTQSKKEITNKYELSNLVFNTFKNIKFENLNIGNTGFLNNYLHAVNKIKTSDFLDSLKKINFNYNETISDQLLSNIININYDKNIRKYLNSVTHDKNKISSFELFIKTWVIFEKTILDLNNQFQRKTKENFIPNFSILSQFKIFTKEELEDLKELRSIRNKLLHGFESIPEDSLKHAYERLKSTLLKAISQIKDLKKKESLTKEFEHLK